MERIEIQAFAKINLCLDVKGLLPGGYHEVHMVMQQIQLHDDVQIRWIPGGDAPTSKDPVRITVRTNHPDLPTDRGNLAWRAAEFMSEKYGAGRVGEIQIDMKKQIPVAAGLAGGSSNCAAVIHGMNCLWKLGLSLEELCSAGSELGSDVPFCVMGQAAADPVLKELFSEDPLACHCAVASGRGTDLEPIKGLEADLILSKPPISVSTPEAYAGIDREEIPRRPDIDEMVRSLSAGDIAGVEKNMINVLENFTLKRYPIVVYTKNKIQAMCNPAGVLMSGSGPTVFGICRSQEEARQICEQMREVNSESFWTETTR